MEELRWTVRQVPDGDRRVAVLDVEGALDSYTSERLSEAFGSLWQQELFHVVVNLGRLHYMSSAGIGLIVEQMEAARARQGDVKLANVPAKILKVLDICGATKLVEVLPTEEAAVQRFHDAPAVSETAVSKEFPRELGCPSCGQVSSVPSPDLYKCAKCSEVFYVDPKGQASLLKKVDGVEVKKVVRKIEMNVQSDLSYIQCVKRFVGDLAGQEGFEQGDVEDLELAVDEALTNVVEHAYHFEDHHFIGLALTFDARGASISIMDHGRAHSPSDAMVEEVVDDFSKRLRRGRGRLLIKKLMDEVEYQTVPGVQNKLVLVKYRQRNDAKGFLPVGG